MESKVNMTMVLLIAFYWINVVEQGYASPLQCGRTDFSALNLTMQPFDSQMAVGFRSISGQAAELLVYIRGSQVVSLATKYLTDKSGFVARFVPSGPTWLVVVGMVPDEPDTTFTFVVCADGTVDPAHSPTKPFTDGAYKEVATATVKEFLNNSTIQPYRAQFIW